MIRLLVLLMAAAVGCAEGRAAERSSTREKSRAGAGGERARTAANSTVPTKAVAVKKAGEVARGYSVIDLGTLGGPKAEAYAINNAGQIVGVADTAVQSDVWGRISHGFLFEGSKMIDLGTMDRDQKSEATGIDSRGLVLGNSILQVGCIVSGRTFTMQERRRTLLKLDKELYTSPRAVNDAGHFAGLCNFGRYIHAFLYDGKLHDLGSLGNEERSEAYGMNNSNDVVGVSSTPKYATGDRAVLWRKREIINLGTLPGHYSSEARGINNRGVIVGWSTPPHKAVRFPRAFIFSNGKMRDLNELLPPNSGWELLEANGINDAGQIVGEGRFKGQQRAFLMSPGRK